MNNARPASRPVAKMSGLQKYIDLVAVSLKNGVWNQGRTRALCSPPKMSKSIVLKGESPKKEADFENQVAPVNSGSHIINAIDVFYW